MKNFAAAYKFFILDTAGEIVSGWEFKMDAKEAFPDQPNAKRIVKRDFLTAKKLASFIARNS